MHDFMIQTSYIIKEDIFLSFLYFFFEKNIISPKNKESLQNYFF